MKNRCLKNCKNLLIYEITYILEFFRNEFAYETCLRLMTKFHLIIKEINKYAFIKTKNNFPHFNCIYEKINFYSFSIINRKNYVNVNFYFPIQFYKFFFVLDFLFFFI